MSTHNIQFHDKKKKQENFPKYLLLGYWKNFTGTQKRIRVIQGKRAINVCSESLRYYCIKVDLHKKKKKKKKKSVRQCL